MAPTYAHCAVCATRPVKACDRVMRYQADLIEDSVTNLYYGWKIVMTLFVTLIFCSGLGFYNHAVILQALVSEKGLSVEIASSAVSLFFLSSGLVGLWIAGMLDRHDVRIVICAGAGLAGVALFSIRFVTSEWQVMLAYSLFGVGFAASGLLPATTLVTRWFAKKRALALSIASTGLSVGGVVITPASALLITAKGIDYSVTLFALVYVLGVVPLACLFLKSRPADIGLQIDGVKMDENSPKTSSTLFKDAARSRYFWGLSLAYVFLMMAQVGALAHQYGLVGEHLTGRAAALALGVIPIASIVGRLAGGFLLDRISASKFALTMMILQSVSLLGLSQVTSTWAFVAGLGLFGISVGNLLMLQPLLIATTYGQQDYSRIYGLSNMMTTIGIAFGPLILGLIYASNNSYSLSYLTASAAGLVGYGIFRWSLTDTTEDVRL
ncbi:MAG: MFS family permease [Candidatus Azotimanducaceae bacterium]|jgi:MFS family permease